MYSYGKLAGVLLFVGGVQFIILMVCAEALYRGYSVSDNYISDLGAGTTALLFNSSVFLLGLFILAATYFIHRAFALKPFCVLLAIAGVGAAGVGLFPETAGIVHGIFSFIVFFFGGLSAISACRIQKPPFSYFSILLGLLTLIALGLFGAGSFLGLGKGGMERMIAYPALLWGVGFGGYLMASAEQGSQTSKR
jgi:hypothetical membrane protein